MVNPIITLIVGIALISAMIFIYDTEPDFEIFCESIDMKFDYLGLGAGIFNEFPNCNESSDTTCKLIMDFGCIEIQQV